MILNHLILFKGIFQASIHRKPWSILELREKKTQVSCDKKKCIIVHLLEPSRTFIDNI